MDGCIAGRGASGRVARDRIDPAPRNATSLVLGHAGVDLVAPGENAALHVLDVLESRLTHDPTRLSAAHAALAVNHDLRVRIELADVLGELAERNQFRARDVADAVFVRFANVDQRKVVPAI